MIRLLLLAMVLLSACAAPAAEVSEAIEPSTSITLTPAATASPETTPAPTVDPARDLAIAFLTRALEGTTSLLDLYDDLVTAVNGADSAVELQLAARELADWTDRERTWLLAHEPEPCYSEAWNGYLEAIEAYNTLGELMEVAAANPRDELATQTALAALEDSTEALQATTGAIESMTCAVQ